MSDLTSNMSRRPNVGRGRNAEFHFYFALIVLLAVPFVTASWVRDIVRLRTLNLRGPLARAWVEADRITPLIFSV